MRSGTWQHPARYEGEGAPRPAQWAVRWLLLGPALLFMLHAAAHAQERDDITAALFAKVFGELAEFDAATRQVILDDEAGKRHYVDRNGDGRPEEVWFIDTHERHPEASRPLLVRVIDEDGDLEPGFEPDLDSDLYIADWKADGVVDCVLDYTDSDGDNDVDEMGIYYPGPLQGYFDQPALRVWWGKDLGDDNRLWHDVGYQYTQTSCEYRTHFGGEELFVAFAITLDGDRWIPFFENPFVFLDHDGDHVTEEVIRFSGIDQYVESYRHSMDVDHDATPAHPRDFDVSLSGWAPGARWTPEALGKGRSLLTMDESLLVYTNLRGFRAGPYLDHGRAASFARDIRWRRLMLTWDEIDLNLDMQRRETDYERWEGIIAAGNEDFMQIGGPHSGHFNRRFELDMEPESAPRIYLHPTDRRLHLHGADRAWLIVDDDLDGKSDLRYDLDDTDGDGFIDRWRLDLDLDGRPEDTWQGTPASMPETVPYAWATLNRMRGADPLELDALARIHAGLLAAMPRRQSKGGLPFDALLEARASLHPEWRPRLARSEEALRYVLQTRIDALLALPDTGDSIGPDRLKAARQARSRGDLAALVEVVGQASGDPLVLFRNAWRLALKGPGGPGVAWSDTFAAHNLGWESEHVAYRHYWGQFDFFGKTGPSLIYPGLESEAVNYHEMQDWGIDALLVGDAAGLGGLVLYVDERRYPVRTPGGEGDITFDQRIIEANGNRVTFEIVADNIAPAEGPWRLRLRGTIESGRRDTRMDVGLEGPGGGADTRLGLEVLRPAQSSVFDEPWHGLLALWGIQDSSIGRIGMGLVYPPARHVATRIHSTSHEVVLDIDPGQTLTYRIVADWLRGMRFNRAPSAQDWRDRVAAIAERGKVEEPAQ